MSDLSLAQKPNDRQALTEFEQDELENNEKVVAYGLSMFVAACYALKNIRDKRLYRADYPTWEQYVANRWADLFSDDSTANRWIATAETLDNLAPIGVTKMRESHARELAKFQPQIQTAVALVGLRAAELERQHSPKARLTASHFKHAGEVIAEMVATQAVDVGDGEQHAITETLAVSVVERRRESLLQHVETNRRKPIIETEVTAGRDGLDVYDERFTPGVTYLVKVYEL